MKFVPVHHGIVKNGNLMLAKAEQWKAWLKKLEGKKVQAIVEEYKSIRSLKINAFYRVYLKVIEKDTGTPADEMHEIAKRKFLKPQIIKFQNEEIKIPGSTTKLDNGEMLDYMEKICKLTGVPIPNPEEIKLI